MEDTSYVLSPLRISPRSIILPEDLPTNWEARHITRAPQRAEAPCWTAQIISLSSPRLRGGLSKYKKTVAHGSRSKLPLHSGFWRLTKWAGPAKALLEPLIGYAPLYYTYWLVFLARCFSCTNQPLRCHPFLLSYYNDIWPIQQSAKRKKWP